VADIEAAQRVVEAAFTEKRQALRDALAVAREKHAERLAVVTKVCPTLSPPARALFGGIRAVDEPCLSSSSLVCCFPSPVLLVEPCPF
jgi:hypothetical protein